MEISIEKGEASDVPKKPRSLDLQSIYVKKSRTSDRKSWSRKELALSEQQSKISRKKRECTFEEGVEVSESKKPTRNEISLSSLEPAFKKQRHISNVPKPKRVVISDVQKEDAVSGSGVASNLEVPSENAECLGIDPYSLLSKKGNTSTSNGSKNNKCMADGFNIPKRPRGISKWRKAKDCVSLGITTNDQFHAKTNTNSGDTKSSIGENLNLQSLNDNKKKNLDEFELNGFHNDDSPRCTDVGNISFSKDENGMTRKRKEKSEGSCLGNGTQLVHDNGDSVADSQDEDNLEENAARMLSSRFDPSCTGFSGKKTIYTGGSVNESVFCNFDQDRLRDSDAEAFSVDPTGRVLRPRRHNGKSFARKRRHFYEVCSKDIDPYCVVKQKIRVFWPLDQSWYFGLVKDYDPVTRLHHIKYDDRDEEWINLQKERFKLLLFPSEVSGKFNLGKPDLAKQNKSEEEAKAMESSYRGGILESEPIISWLKRTTRRVTSSPSSRTKKHIRVSPLKNIGSSLLSELKETMSMDLLDKKQNKLFSSCNESEQSCGHNGIPEQKKNIESKDWKLPYVYFRKRFRNKKEILDTGAVQGGTDASRGGSMSTPIANTTTGVGEFKKALTLVCFKEEIFQLNLPSQCSLDHAFRSKNFWLNHDLYIVYHGKLVCPWPAVRMEVFFIDNVPGFRFLLFEGSLKRAVSLFCLIITIVDQNVMKTNFTEPELPRSSIEFRISRLNSLSKDLLFVLNLFPGIIEGSRWRYFEGKLKSHCGKDALSTAEYMCSNTSNLPCSEMLDNLVASVERFLARSNVDPNLNSVINYSAQDCTKPFQYSVFLASGPSFSFSLYQKLLVDKDEALGDCVLVSSQKYAGNTDILTTNGCSYFDDSSKQAPENLDVLGSSFSQVATSHVRPSIDALSAGNDDDLDRLDEDFFTEVNVLPASVGGSSGVVKNTGNNVVVQIGRSSEAVISKFAEDSCSGYPELFSLTEKPLDGAQSSCTNNDEAQLLDEVEKHSLRKGLLIARPASSMWHRSPYTSFSRTFIHTPKLSSDLVANGPTSGYKRPRTQVSYAQSSSSYEYAAKRQNNHQKTRPHQKDKTHITNMFSDSSKSQSFSASLACDANVLVTHGDKCWREFGAKIQLDCDDQKNWRICVKLSGVIKYVYKAHHVLQPGTTNRFTHAMMWKGGKEWVLEFTDRNQWHIFKQIHEECFNQNIRAASVKNIPIPGVRLLSDGDDGYVEVPFVRSSFKYFRQIGTEVDLALDPSRVLYDMDSEDEEWISSRRVSRDASDSKMPDVAENMFERVMDMFEKLAYTKQCEELTNDDVEKHTPDVGPADSIKVIYDYWKQKRKKKGLPLVRQFQPPLWERYQQELKEWESDMNRMPIQAEGCQNKAHLLKKPPMFAFCLRPRGLEIPNKGSKQRSHKRLMYNGHHNVSMREQEGFHTFGRKMDGLSVGELTVSSYESSDSYHGFHSRSTFSPRDTASTESMYTNDGSERWSDSKFYSTSRKIDAFLSPRDPQGTPFSCNQRSRNGINRRSSEFCEWSSIKQTPPTGFPRHHIDMDEFRLRDATNAAQHALNMAKLKREKAQWLLHKADLALHRATVALITAEAIKASEEDVGDD